MCSFGSACRDSARTTSGSAPAAYAAARIQASTDRASLRRDASAHSNSGSYVFMGLLLGGGLETELQDSHPERSNSRARNLAHRRRQKSLQPEGRKIDATSPFEHDLGERLPYGRRMLEAVTRARRNNDHSFALGVSVDHEPEIRRHRV